MNYLPMMRALLLSVALIVPALHGMLEVTTSSEEVSAQLRSRGYTPLHRAAYFGRVDIIEDLIAAAGRETNTLVQAKNYSGSTPLHVAAEQGHVRVVKALIDHHPSLVNIQDNDGCTPLHYAAANGHTGVLLCLIVHGANKYLANKRGLLPFHRATQHGHLGAMKILLPSKYKYREQKYFDFWSRAMTCSVEGGKIEALAVVMNMRPEKGTGGVTPLMLAASYGKVPLMHWCLEQEGVLIDEVDRDGKCALHYAARHGQAGAVRFLLERDPELVKKRDNHGDTPLHEAAEGGHREVIELLLQYNAEINAHGARGWTPLQRAAFTGHTQALQELINRGASLTITDKCKCTALHLAAVRGQKDCVELLLAANADIEAKDSLQRTPLLCAALGGHLEIIKRLLRLGADIKQQTNDGNALMMAVVRNHVEVMQYLIDNTAVELTSCNTYFSGAVPVLFAAAKFGNCEASRFLIKKGAALDVQLTDGRTVLHCAAQKCADGLEYHGVVRLLVRAAADMLRTNNAGVTPLDILKLSERFPTAKDYFQNRRSYLSGRLRPEDNLDSVFSVAVDLLDIPVLEALRDQLGERLSRNLSKAKNLLMVAIAMHDFEGIDWLLDQGICDMTHKVGDEYDALGLALERTSSRNNITRLSLVNKLLRAGAVVAEGHLIDEAKRSDDGEVLMKLLLTYRYSQQPVQERLCLFK